jgi:ABC-type transport system involved in multi-copper enzyme maturation permease subunit
MTDQPTHTTPPAPDDLGLLADIAETAHPAPPAPRQWRPSLAPLRHLAGGVTAVGAKELRGRMRGRRAFAILTIYLVLLGFAWMVELIMERAQSSGLGTSPATASAQIGQAIFAALLMLETLQVVFLAPASTAGAISLEREKRTLELLVVTPISSLAIVLGKLLSALVYVWLLIAASIPLTAVVFVYGGVAPEDVVRGYLVLVVAALGFGAFGLFASSLVKRTQAATAVSVFGVMLVSIGSIFLLVFWQVMAASGDGRGMGPIKDAPPPVIAYLNPFIAQADVLCGTETSGGGWCGLASQLIGQPASFSTQPTGPVPEPLPAPVAPAAPPAGGAIDSSGGVTAPDVIVKGGTVVGPTIVGGGVAVPNLIVKDGVVIAGSGGVNGGGVALGANDVAPGVPFGVAHDTIWPLCVLTWLILAVAFLLGSVQFVSPTRRWRLRRGRRAGEGAT